MHLLRRPQITDHEASFGGRGDGSRDQVAPFIKDLSRPAPIEGECTHDRPAFDDIQFSRQHTQRPWRLGSKNAFFLQGGGIMNANFPRRGVTDKNFAFVHPQPGHRGRPLRLHRWEAATGRVMGLTGIKKLMQNEHRSRRRAPARKSRRFPSSVKPTNTCPDDALTGKMRRVRPARLRTK